MALVRGITKNGDEVFYTGKAGPAFVSAHTAEAFTGYNLEGARAKALTLNKMTELHGVRFIGMLTDAEHAELGSQEDEALS